MKKALNTITAFVLIVILHLVEQMRIIIQTNGLD
jgi:hypothetical protein